MNSQILINSLDCEANREQVFKAGEGEGKSGSFFFFTHDNRFIIKTMKSSEMKKFLSFLTIYRRFLMRNPNSLLAKILGVYTIK